MNGAAMNGTLMVVQLVSSGVLVITPSMLTCSKPAAALPGGA